MADLQGKRYGAIADLFSTMAARLRIPSGESSRAMP
jgi:hypothetical protein